MESDTVGRSLKSEIISRLNKPLEYFPHKQIAVLVEIDQLLRPSIDNQSPSVFEMTDSGGQDGSLDPKNLAWSVPAGAQATLLYLEKLIVDRDLVAVIAPAKRV